MYILLLPFILVILSFLSKRYKSPLYLYFLFLSIYPVSVYVYVNYMTAGNLPDVIPIFSDRTYKLFYFLSFFSILFMALGDFFASYFTRIDKVRYLPVLADNPSSQIALLFSFMLLMFMYSYVFINREVFIDSYVYQLLRSEGFSSQISNKINVYSSLEVLFLISVFYLLLTLRSVKVVLVVLFAFLLLKLMIGSRLMLLPPLLFLLWIQIQKADGISSLKGVSFRKAVSYLFLLVLLFIAFNVIRAERSGGISLFVGLFNFLLEFVFATISSLYSISYVEVGNAPNGMLMSIDGFMASIPSVFFGGAEEKKLYLEYENWKRSIGGYSNISPVGGYFIVGQVFLMFKNVYFCFLFFLIYGFLLNLAEYKLKVSRSKFSKLFFSQVIFFGIIYGVRTEFWVLQKSIIQQYGVITLLFLVFIFLARKLLVVK